MIDRSGVGNRFFMLGHVNPIDDFLSAVDAIAIPSRFEGLPVIALEALAAGTPGVAANIDGLRDVWPPGWLSSPGDPAGLADGLDRVLAADPAEKAPPLRDGRARMEQMTSLDPAAAIETLLRRAPS
jgi:glycosyltransferase involved in cell wall biosynthesis